MATIDVQKELSGGAEVLYLWETLVAANADGEAVDTPGLPFKSVQVSGTFDTGTVTFQGSLDGATWFTLQNPAGGNLAFTAAGGGQIRDGGVRFVRPLLSGAGSDDVDARLYAAR